ncbi:hypothetical protein BXZ70DRAFT_496426 [Cristinia sonorae]|uniref:Uncharacterized protein n=1 Tax=Cristinia sonorae TaxID=1940300 RepID=A0A8K0XLG3_9AGAR|nr:hypothetical protein BXZ70DRAFT_496426 [Cristinia sonorae]
MPKVTLNDIATSIRDLEVVWYSLWVRAWVGEDPLFVPLNNSANKQETWFSESLGEEFRRQFKANGFLVREDYRQGLDDIAHYYTTATFREDSLLPNSPSSFIPLTPSPSSPTILYPMTPNTTSPRSPLNSPTKPDRRRGDYLLRLGRHSSLALTDTHVARHDCAGGVLVSGQAEIGKTIFLAFLLLMRLRAHLPTIWIDNPDYLIYFNHNGVHEIQLSRLDPAAKWRIFPLPNTWVLCDSNYGLAKPPSKMLALDLFTVIAGSSHLDWSRNLAASSGIVSKWFMQPWETSELMAAQPSWRTLITAEDIQKFCAIFGTAPGMVRRNAEIQQSYENLMQDLTAPMTSEALETIVEDVVGSNVQSAIASGVFKIVPCRDRTKCRVDLVSKDILKHIYHRCLIKQPNKVLAIFRSLSFAYDRFAPCLSGFLLEKIYHNVFLRGVQTAIYPLGTVRNPDGSACNRWRPQPYDTESDRTKCYLTVSAGTRLSRFITAPVSSPRVWSIHKRPNHKTISPVQSVPFYMADLVTLHHPLHRSGYFLPDGTMRASADSFVLNLKDMEAVVFQVAMDDVHRVEALGFVMLRNLGVLKIVYVAVVPKGRHVEFVVDERVDKEELVDEQYMVELDAQQLTSVFP